MSEQPKKSFYKYLHGTYKRLKEDSGNAVVYVVKDVDTGVSKLHILENPKRSIYVTKEGLRALHNRKKEFAYKNELDEYKVYNHKLKEELKKALGIFPKKYVSEAELLNSPYVYGASIDMDVLIKQHYANSTEKEPSEYRVGGLDIETSVLGGQEVMVCTYVSHDHRVYTAILAGFLKSDSMDKINAITKKALETFKDALNKKGRVVYDKYVPNVNFHVAPTELGLIRWIFEKIHQERDDFISVWNIGFDIPYLLNRIRFHGGNPYNIMCHPDVPYQYRTCEFKEDKSKLIAHYSHKWSMFELSGYTQFYDSMCLYSRLRKVDGNLPSYTLKAIATDVLGTAKLDFGEDNHYKMQANRFEEYVAYNIIDSILLTVMEKVLNDVPGMLLLMTHTSIGSFSKQTAQLSDIFHNYCKQNGAVSGSCKGSLATEYDHLIQNVGGGVLSPNLTKGTGTKKVKEIDKEVAACCLVSDLDVVSFYPNMEIAANISRQTKLANMLTIEGFKNEDINDFFGHAVLPEENCVYLGKKFFGLPNYEDALNEFAMFAEV